MTPPTSLAGSRGSGSRAGALALVLAPALFVAEAVASLVAVGDQDRTSLGLLQAIDAHQHLWLLGTLAAIIGSVLLVPAVHAAVALTSTAAPRLSSVSAALLVPGVVGVAMHTVFWNVDHGAFATDPHRLARAPEALDANPAFGVLFAMIVLGFDLGLLVLAVTVWRSRVAARWVPWAVAAFPLLDVTMGGHNGYLIGMTLLTAGFTGLAIRTLRPLDDAHTDTVQAAPQTA